MRMNDLLHAAVDSGASDILLVAGAPPMFRIAGELEPADMLPAMTSSSLEEVCGQVLSDEQRQTLHDERDVDFSMSVPSLGRFRFNVHIQRNTHAAAIRYIPNFGSHPGYWNTAEVCLGPSGLATLWTQACSLRTPFTPENNTFLR